MFNFKYKINFLSELWWVFNHWIPCKNSCLHFTWCISSIGCVLSVTDSLPILHQNYKRQKISLMWPYLEVPLHTFFYHSAGSGKRTHSQWKLFQNHAKFPNILANLLLWFWFWIDFKKFPKQPKKDLSQLPWIHPCSLASDLYSLVWWCRVCLCKTQMWLSWHVWKLKRQRDISYMTRGHKRKTKQPRDTLLLWKKLRSNEKWLAPTFF